MITGPGLHLASGIVLFLMFCRGRYCCVDHSFFVAGVVVRMTRTHFPQIEVHLADAIRIARAITKIRKQRARYRAFCFKYPKQMRKKNSDYYQKHRSIILERRKEAYSWKKLLLMPDAVWGTVAVL